MVAKLFAQEMFIAFVSKNDAFMALAVLVSIRNGRKSL